MDADALGVGTLDGLDGGCFAVEVAAIVAAGGGARNDAVVFEVEGVAFCGFSEDAPDLLVLTCCDGDDDEDEDDDGVATVGEIFDGNGVASFCAASVRVGCCG